MDAKPSFYLLRLNQTFPKKTLGFANILCIRHILWSLDGYAGSAQPREKRQLKTAHLLSLILIAIIVLATFSILASPTLSVDEKPQAPVYIGVAYGGNSTEGAKLVIDRTKGYTNLFVLDAGINQISANRTAVEEICDYATAAGLNIIVNLGTWAYAQSDWEWKVQFYNYAKERYGDKFLGVYYDDELAGIPFNWDWPAYYSRNSSVFNESREILRDIHYKLELAGVTGKQPDNYDFEAQFYKQLALANNHTILTQQNITTFTSDYLLYWYDYLSNYDTIFAQFGWNQSVNQQISLVRGAATMQNKDWGVIATWKYMQPPYLDTGQNLYNQMKTAYNAGAKYILIFDIAFDNGTSPYGTMKTEHFQALKTFWEQVVTKQPPTSPPADAVLVLPHNYGSGLGSATDKIWGFWGPDDKSATVWNTTQTLLNKYGTGLDIIYEDPSYPIQGNYSRVYYWNQTILE